MSLIDIEDPMYDFASLEANLDGVNYALKELKYESEMDGAGIVYGNSRRPVGRTLGRVKATASMVMYMAQANNFIAALGPGFMTRIFAVVAKFSVPGSDIVIDTVLGCRVTKVGGGGSEGGDALTREFTLQPMAVLYNGYDPLGEALTLL